jgi:hypothetical protein
MALWINAAQRGSGIAWVRHGMCELAFTRSPFCVLNFMFATCRPNFGAAGRNTRKVQRVRCTSCYSDISASSSGPFCEHGSNQWTTVLFMKIQVLRNVTPCRYARMYHAFTNSHSESPINTGHHMELPHVITASHRQWLYTRTGESPTDNHAKRSKVNLLCTIKQVTGL